MVGEFFGYHVNILEGIARAHGNVDLDRGGYWSKDYNIWVDRKLPDYLRKPALSSELKFIEVLGAIGLTAGKLFSHQLADAENGVMWPKEVLGEDGAKKLFDAAKINPSILEPYSIIPNGLEKKSVPYSIAYANELEELVRQILIALDTDSPSVKAQREYLISLLKAYTLNPERKSDLPQMEAADREWINISPDAQTLVLIEPTETYYDPALDALGQDKGIVELANQETNRNGLGPWRPFFEFKVMINDERSMIDKNEIDIIRQKSRELYRVKNDKVVPVSLEFRRLLMASGQGSHPVKMAKNYPNSEKIRDHDGYKNILYTNMIEEATLTEQIPAIEAAFGKELIAQFSEQQLVRGSSLMVVGHEENHPFRRFRDAPLEELKATINGFKAIFESKQFSSIDMNAAILANIGSSLYEHSGMVEARKKGDKTKIRSRGAYYKGDTILMNYLIENGGFKMEKGKAVRVDFDVCQKIILELSDHLEKIRTGDQSTTIPKFYNDYNKEDVWNHFSILDSSKK